jgi:hypothetical protein
MSKYLKSFHESGQISKWFSWIEALTLTSALLVVGINTQVWALTLLGILSLIFIWISSCYTLAEMLGNGLPKIMDRKVGLPLAYLLGLSLPLVMLWVVSLAISGLIYGA